MSDQLRKDLMAEYFKVYEAVVEYDKRLLTVKGWGVTLSLAALAWGFEKSNSGLFLVAALSGAAFWAIEAVFKRFQMRYYVRMRDIEVACFELFGESQTSGITVSSPLISWAFFQAPEYFRGHLNGPLPRPATIQGMPKYYFTWLYGGVMFPHVVAVVGGLALFLLCHSHYLSIYTV